METKSKKRICLVVSSIVTAEAFLLGHLAALAKVYDVVLIANCRDKHHLRQYGLQVEVLYVPLVREISPIRDLACLFKLTEIFMRNSFDVIHSITPKAGLLAMLAGHTARVPVRMHTFTGQVWATQVGMRKMVLKNLDRILAACATHILVDSRSQMDFLLRQSIVSAWKAGVLAHGSISGVDTKRFHPDKVLRDKMRATLGIPGDAVVFAYVGRLKREKGVLDLAAAFSALCRMHSDVYLILAGPDEEHLRPEIERTCESCAERLRLQDFTTTPEHYMICADVLCLPSYREGFGSVIIEAAACGVPAVGSRIYGVTDAISEELTGILHEPGNVEELTSGMQRMVQDPEARTSMGKHARVRAEWEFAKEISTAALLQFYRQILG